MNPKNSRKKSPIHENADANKTCDFGDGDISRSRRNDCEKSLRVVLFYCEFDNVPEFSRLYTFSML